MLGWVWEVVVVAIFVRCAGWAMYDGYYFTRSHFLSRDFALGFVVGLSLQQCFVRCFQCLV